MSKNTEKSEGIQKGRNDFFAMNIQMLALYASNDNNKFYPVGILTENVTKCSWVLLGKRVLLGFSPWRFNIFIVLERAIRWGQAVVPLFSKSICVYAYRPRAEETAVQMKKK